MQQEAPESMMRSGSRLLVTDEKADFMMREKEW
jgi:hypothetical protein